MVKRVLLLLMMVLLLVTPLSFAKEPTIVDDGGFLTEEEHEQLQFFLNNLQTAFDTDIGVFLLTPERTADSTVEFREYLNEKYSIESEKFIVFAYNAENESFYGFSSGFEHLNSEKQQQILDDVATADLGSRAVSYVNQYFVKAVPFMGDASTALLPTPELGEQSEDEDGQETPTEAAPTESKEEVTREAKVYLEDKADLWSAEEETKLIQKAEEISKKEDVAILLATVDENPKKSAEAYIEDLAEEKFGIDTNQVAFLIDMDNRRVEINTAGKTIDILDDIRIEDMLAKILDQGMKKQDYFRAADLMLDDTANYLAQGVHAEHEGRKERTEPNNLSVTDGLAGLGAAGVGGLGFFGRTKKRYARKAAPLRFQYMNNIIGGLPSGQGRLIDSSTTKRQIPKSTDSGGGGGRSSTTHRSSSGGTRGGGGASF